MMEIHPAMLLIVVAGTAIVFLFSIPSIIAIISHLRHEQPKWSGYEDKDGIASEEAVKSFTNRIPKILICASASLGCLILTALAILSTLGSAEGGNSLRSWLGFGSSFCILIQATTIAFTRNPTWSYSLGIYTALSSLSLFIILLIEDAVLSQCPEVDQSRLSFGLRIAALALTICTLLGSILIPRRPELTLDGVPVDGSNTVSALVRYSFTWCEHLLVLAAKKQTLNLDDLPKMGHHTRSKDICDAWSQKRKFWVSLVLQYKWPLAKQWIITAIQAILIFAPQFMLLQILRVLEKRQVGHNIGSEAWIWALGLGLCTVIAEWIESWLFWISWSEIAIPVRSQLSALIFQKAMRRKDVKGVSAKRKGDEKKGTLDAEIGATPIEEPDTADKLEFEGGDEGNEAQKSNQSTLNLIGVDAKRVSEFCSLNNILPGSLFKLIVSFTFLLKLIGWKSLAAGLLTTALIVPVNIFFTKRYTAAQDRLMKVRDTKMSIVTEALTGIRQIKYSALEKQWQDKIGKVRSKELTEQWNVFVADTVLVFCWFSSPVLLAATSLSVYALLYGELTPSVAFTAIGVFRSLELTLGIIPELVTNLVDAWISIKRVEEYIAAPEISVNTKDAAVVSFENASIAWPSDEEKGESSGRYVLRDISISFPENELSVVSGKTGSGKSLLLASILGEVDVLSGSVNVPRQPHTLDRYDDKATNENWVIPSYIAFVAQIPWIENASIRDNILFGLPFNEDRYSKVLNACALRKDLEMLVDGERTEIGANGIGLSGGQRWRITFARALYSRAGILILDDIFSAVDAHVARFIFENGLTGDLGIGRTRILVTHHVSLCKSKTKYIVELGDGTVQNSGFIQELEEEGTLQQMINHEETLQEIQHSEEIAMYSEEIQHGGQVAMDSEVSSDDESNAELLEKAEPKPPKKFVEDEGREHGGVKMTVYARYLKSSGGWPFWVSVLFLYVTHQILIVERSWWLRLWTGSYDGKAITAQLLNHFFQLHTPTSDLTTESLALTSSDLKFYLLVYVSLCFASVVLIALRFFFVYIGSIRASKKLFERLSFTVLRTPLRWIDTVPLGRILNRFTADFNVVDSHLIIAFSFGVGNIFNLMGVIVAGLIVSPYIIILVLAQLCICLCICLRYLAGAREVKRLESNTKSPIFEQFGSALTGVSTIRAFSKSDMYISRMLKKIDDYTSTLWHLWLFNRWMGWRMSIVGALFTTAIAVLIVSIKGIDAALAGFALAFSIGYTETVIWAIRNYTQMELNMNSVERIIEYSNVPTESLDGVDPPAAWPFEGRLEVNNLVVGYAPDLPPILKGLTFRVERNERIGVVGRTGAGKSSLTLALLRFLEAREGSIYIDGLDISKINLHALRSRIAIIPQDPVLFSGTIRSNLDAFDEHTDEELRFALRRVHLIPENDVWPQAAERDENGAAVLRGANQNENLFTSLLSTITEGGLNLSQGQRQLLCLARALVSRPKILILDEATSAVDMDADALIQRSIREEFTDSTLIVIAHRLSTIADFDRILVMDDGILSEFDSPGDLLEQGGIFASMVKQSGEREQLEDMILGAVGRSNL